MKQLVILSGKGGTGKTTVTAALAPLVAQELSLVLVDADVDAANLELLLSARIREEHEFRGGKVALVDAGRCLGCGKCAEICRFEAVEVDGVAHVDALACEGCAACFYECPVQALSMQERVSGVWFLSETSFGPLFHARLFPGQENSGKLVYQVKLSARQLASRAGAALLLVDGPPGIGCPAIAALSGASLVLLVTEPSVAAIHDLRRALALARHLAVPAAVCLNKADLSPERASEIEDFSRAEGLPLVGRIPFDEGVVRALVAGLSPALAGGKAVAEAIGALWQGLRPLLLSA
jgi:MinD superfamily P-loop ATPase